MSFDKSPQLPFDPRILLAGLGFLLLPLIGWLYHPRIGLALFAISLAVTAMMTWQLGNGQEERAARLLRGLGMLLGLLALSAIALLVLSLRESIINSA